MRSYLRILAKALKKAGLSHRDIATAMGWKSAGAAGHKLRGIRPITAGELQRMCELAGITLVDLAAASDDLKLVKKPKAAQLASIGDDLSDEKLALLLEIAKSYRDG